MSRQCSDTWLTTFKEFAENQTDAPIEYIFWSGVFTVAAAMRRRVSIPSEFFGAWNSEPYMYIMLVGPLGMRKTTVARRFGATLLRQAGIKEGSSNSSVPGIFQELKAAPDNALFIIAEEFGEMISKSAQKGEDMYDFFNGLYDGKPFMSENTISRGSGLITGAEILKKPCLNILGATTPRWISERMTVLAIEGGLSSRFLFIYGDKLRNKSLFRYDEMVNPKYPILEKKLVNDLKEISELEGNFKVTRSAIDYGNDWYSTVPEPHEVSPKLAPYISRKHVHMLKVAMAMSVSESSNLVIDRHHIESAIEVLDINELKMLGVYQTVGENKHAMTMKDIIKFVEKRDGIAREGEVRREFSTRAEPRKIQELIEGCIENEQLIRTTKITVHNGTKYETTFLERINFNV